MPKELIFTSHISDVDYHFYEYLLLERDNYSVKLWNQNLTREAGFITEIEGYEVEILNIRAKATAETKYFTQPNENSNCYKIKMYDFDMECPESYAIPGKLIDTHGNLYIIGVYQENPEWLCIVRVFSRGGYNLLYIDKPHDTNTKICWVKRSAINT